MIYVYLLVEGNRSILYRKILKQKTVQDHQTWRENRGGRSEIVREEDEDDKNRLNDLMKREIRFLQRQLLFFLSFLSFLPILILIPATLIIINGPDDLFLWCCCLVLLSARSRTFWIINWALLWISSWGSSFSIFVYTYGLFLAIIAVDWSLWVLSFGVFRKIVQANNMKYT